MAYTSRKTDMNHLANASVPLIQRTTLADLALALANAMIEQEIAVYHNSRKHYPEDDTEQLYLDCEAAINKVFEIRKSMQFFAAEVSSSLR